MRWIQPPASLPANWFHRALVAGFFASVLSLIAFVNLYGVAWLFGRVEFTPVQGGSAISQWFRALVENTTIDLARANLAVATVVHLIAGVTFAVIYAYFFRDRFIGPSWRRGALFALIPWACSLLIFLPAMGAGIFGLSLQAGPLVILGSLLLHMVYGVTLGLTYVSIGHGALAEHGMSAIDQHTQYKSERAMAVGIGGGVVLGGVIGSILAAVPQALPSMSLGIDPWFYAPGAALIGGAWGGLAASMWGLPQRQSEELQLVRETGGVAPTEESRADYTVPVLGVAGRRATPIAFRWRGDLAPEDWAAFYDRVIAKLPASARMSVDVRADSILPPVEAEARMVEVRDGLRSLGLNDDITREAA